MVRAVNFLDIDNLIYGLALAIACMAYRSSVAITIVTFNSSRYIRQCLGYALAQDYPNTRVVVVDNASTDDTSRILEDFAGRVHIVYNLRNRGFAGGQNQARESVQADWSLALNPDVRLTPDFVSRLVSAAETDPAIGSACGKLLAMSADFQPAKPSVFDSTGIYMTPNMRHFDRGSLEPDHGQYDQPAYVFGATGAACLYRRSMIEDVSFNGEFFDDDFFAYREDADVAWRAQLLGWRCLYLPDAVAYHVRSVLPSNRSQLPALINMHSVKNRWLLRIKNITSGLLRRHWLAMGARDLLVLAGCLLKEWRSLKAFLLLAKAWKRAWRKRAVIMAKRRSSDDYINNWFCDSPVSYPAAILDREKTAPR